MWKRIRCGTMAVLFVLGFAGASLAQTSSPAPRGNSAAGNGEAIYQLACAACHEASADARAPAIAAMRSLSPENILRSLESGVMREQGQLLSAGERRAVAEFLAGRPLGSDPAPSASRCADARLPWVSSGPAWKGWSPDLANTRFQPETAARLTAADVPRLELKWAFGLPAANGLPTVAGGRLFVPTGNRMVYSIDAKSGCVYWTFEPAGAIRGALSVAALPGSDRQVVFFGDRTATAYAVDATSGELVWKTRVDDHPRSAIVGSVAYASGRLFVPVTAAEEGLAPNSAYECCTARGALVALDAATGKQIWKTFTIDEPARTAGRNAAGTPVWGPSGASIWSAPTIDLDRQLVYAATGNNFTPPATKYSDALVAFDINTGVIRWARQFLADDLWNNACISVSRANCPDSAGPDADFASPPILATLPDGKQLLLLGAKSAITYAVDPERRGELVWTTRVGKGGVVGGILHGSAFDGRYMYVPVSDQGFVSERIEVGARLVTDPKVGGGFHALDAATGARVWSVMPPPCPADRPTCSPGQPAAATVMSGVAFSASLDGHLRAYSTADGTILWDFDTIRPYTTVNGVSARGGAMNGPGPTVADGGVYVVAGGNVLLAFSVGGK